jgi:APA family basic amino acid/polyamine antiporter
MFPKAGGQYIYLKEAFNPLIGFLYGWSFFTVIQTGSIAAVGVAFSKFSAYLFPVLSEKNILFSVLGLHISAAQLTSIALIIFLSFINTRGVQYGKYVQSIFTVTKLLALFGLVVFGFILTANTETWHHNWETGFSIQQLTSSGFLPYTGWAAFGAIAASMVGSLFSSDSWNNVTFIAGEIQNPQRNIGLSLFLGTLIVTSIYLLANIMYVSVLDLPVQLLLPKMIE